MTPQLSRSIQVQVKLNADGSVTCEPSILQHVHPGDVLEWTGQEHDGEFDGKVLGIWSEMMSLREWMGFPRDRSKAPCSTRRWHNGDRVQIAPDAEPGAYRCHIRVGDRVIDPIVIVEETEA